MNRSLPTTLLCTVGTSLFQSNLEKVREEERPDLYAAYRGKDWDAVAALLAEEDACGRLCGAEINSVESLLKLGLVDVRPRLIFFHSDTDLGRDICSVLCAYYALRGINAEGVCIEQLQDQDPEAFCRQGLRELAKAVCRVVRDYSPQWCAINATGGYKAQIAVAVLLGQALGIPVYYKHEHFDQIIPFPPMPVALDFDYWMEISGLLFSLSGADDVATLEDFELAESERLQSLINVETIDGRRYIELSPTGQIFHETFRMRFQERLDQVLPPAVPEKEKLKPLQEDSGHMQGHPEIMRFMERMTRELPQVRRCRSFYFNPALSKRTAARVGSKGIEVALSDGTYTVGIAVDSLATSDSQRRAVAARINMWIDSEWRKN